MRAGSGKGLVVRSIGAGGRVPIGGTRLPEKLCDLQAAPAIAFFRVGDMPEALSRKVGQQKVKWHPQIMCPYIEEPAGRCRKIIITAWVVRPQAAVEEGIEADPCVGRWLPSLDGVTQ